MKIKNLRNILELPVTCKRTSGNLRIHPGKLRELMKTFKKLRNPKTPTKSATLSPFTQICSLFVATRNDSDCCRLPQFDGRSSQRLCRLPQRLCRLHQHLVALPSDCVVCLSDCVACINTWSLFPATVSLASATVSLASTLGRFTQRLGRSSQRLESLASHMLGLCGVVH